MTSVHLDVLGSMALQLGISGGELVAVEEAARLHHVFEERRVALSKETVLEFITRFGDAARIEIRTGDLVELAMEPSTPAADIDAFIARSPTAY